MENAWSKLAALSTLTLSANLYIHMQGGALCVLCVHDESQ